MDKNKTSSSDNLIKRSHETQTHIDCLRTKVCQETDSFKGTEHKGVDVCEDGCVWFDPRELKKENLR